MGDEKKCSTCGEIKPFPEFCKDSRRKNGIGSQCLLCHNESSRKSYSNNKDKIALYVKEYNQKNREKILKRQKKWREENKELIRDIRRNYLDKNKDILNKKKRDRYKENPEYYKAQRDKRKEEHKEYMKKYYKENKEKLRRKRNEYKAKRRMHDELFALSERIGHRIRSGFRNNGFIKKSYTEQILGCSCEFFKEYIESQFTEGMSWDNRSEWHLDHIVPISYANTEEEVIRLNHYTNFQPLWAIDNMSKNNKIIEGTQLKIL